MKPLTLSLLLLAFALMASCKNTVEAQYAAVETEKVVLTLDGEPVAVIHAEKTQGQGVTIVVDDMEGNRLSMLGKK